MQITKPVPSYGELLKQTEWMVKRQEILSRDAYRCRNCQGTTQLQVHHRQYHLMSDIGEFVPPWSYKNRYLITLCDSCHKEGHKQYKVPVFKIKGR